MVFDLIWGPRASPGGRGEGFDAGPPQVGAGSLSFRGFSRFLVVLLGLTAGFPTLPALSYVADLWKVFYIENLTWAP